MSREASAATQIRPDQVELYLRRNGHPDARLVDLRPLGQETQAGLKGYGYGRPLQATFVASGREQRLVLRTMSPDPFGHVRRADRADQMILCYDTFDTIPRHIHAQDCGAFGGDGELVSVPRGEFFLVTNYVEGELYARDLDQLRHRPEPTALDLTRTRALASYLAELHRTKTDPALYRRHLRDTVGSGEGIFGQCDAYPETATRIAPERLRHIEEACVRWRWRLHDLRHRCCRTHGDFHPFNILFREGGDFSVLDCSRGGVGEAADDVVCLAINYLFFAISAQRSFDGALRRLWSEFWETYLRASNDQDVLATAPLYLTWRALVLASPVWYPSLEDGLRDRLLRMAERGLALERFDPMAIDGLLS